MKIKFGALVVAGSGKIGGHVVAKNRGGAYMRTKITPSNPNTTAQQNSRSLLASLSAQWRTLNEETRLAWNSAVGDYAKTDIFGDIRNPSGLNLFVKLNANINKIGGALLTDVPAKLEVPYSELIAVDAEIANATIQCVLKDNAYDGQRLYVSATPAMSNGISFVKSEYRGIGSVLVAGATFDINSLYIAKFGVPIIGQKIKVQIQVVLPTGQVGGLQSLDMLVNI